MCAFKLNIDQFFNNKTLWY